MIRNKWKKSKLCLVKNYFNVIKMLHNKISLRCVPRTLTKCWSRKRLFQARGSQWYFLVVWFTEIDCVTLDTIMCGLSFLSIKCFSCYVIYTLFVYIHLVYLFPYLSAVFSFRSEVCFVSKKDRSFKGKDFILFSPVRDIEQFKFAICFASIR